MTAPEYTLTQRATDADKKTRDRLCYPMTQLIWCAVSPICFLASWLIAAFSHIAGKHGTARKTKEWIRREILTPANCVSSARLCLVGDAIALFFFGAPFARQTELLTVAIAADFIDGPTARNNNEITALGTYLDHIGDWGTILWVIFLNIRLSILPIEFLAAAAVILPILFLIYAAKFRKCYDPESAWHVNLRLFANEELQTDFWGRLQFVLLACALFGSLFLASADDPTFFFSSIARALPASVAQSLLRLSLAFFLILGGWSIRDVRDFSEAHAKRFREKINAMKKTPR